MLTYENLALRVAVLLVVAWASGTALTAAEPMESMLNYVPEDANSLAVIRIKELVNSPRGLAEKWAEQHETEFLAGAANVPPWVELLMRAERVKPGVGGGGDYTVVLLPLPADYDMQRLAEREQTEVQQIAERNAVYAPVHGGYFVELPPTGETRLLGAMAPATRQDVAHWVLETADTPTLNEFLATAAQDDSAHVMLAVNLEHLLDPVFVRYRLDGAVALDGKSREKNLLTLAFQTLQGLKFAVRVEETVSAEVTVEFGRSLGDEAQYVKPLLIEFMHDAGAALDEFDEAQVKSSGRIVTLTMPLSDESLRRVLSFLTHPPPPRQPGSTPAVPPQEPSDPDAPDVVASKRYFRAVDRTVDDLYHAYNRAKNYSKTSQWHENFARKIEQLPTKGVDPDLIEYGQKMSDWYRAVAASLQGTQVKVDALNKSVVYNVDVYSGYGGWGGGWGGWGARTAWGPWTYGQPYAYTVNSNLRDVRAKQAEVVAESDPERQQIWQMIDQERAAMRRTMQGRYGDSFLN